MKNARQRLPTGRLPPSSMDVLVVDDDPQLRETAVEILAMGGFAVAGASNGAEALARLDPKQEPPTLVLLDLRMPVMDGWTFLRKRAQSASLSGVPVMILSGEPPEPALLKSVQGWISKPFTEDDLLNAVADALLRIQAAKDEGDSLSRNEKVPRES